MGNQDDKLFMKRFSGIIVGLVIVAVLLIVIASFSDSAPEEDNNPSRIALADERTAPVGAVRTRMPPAPAAEEAAPAPAEAAPPETEAAAIDGAAVFASACQACHMTGAAGAPIPGSDAWAERAAKGRDMLVSSAINGIGAMPAKGGFAHLSDDEVAAAVEHMLAP